VVLTVTGFPQKFFPGAWTDGVVGLLGGIDRVRLLHRGAGFAFAALCVLHVATTLADLRRPGAVLAMAATRQDVADALASLRHELGGGPASRFDRFDYRQKFEYWGLLFGGLLMIGTGFVLLYPTVAARFLGGQLIPAAKAAHSNEGLMAFLVVIVWHMVHVVLSPHVFPMDRAIFTGRISTERMEHEHPLELARARGEDVPPAGPPATLRNLVLAVVQSAMFAVVMPALGLVAVGDRLWRGRKGARL
jgi:formate dehydrogenase subunit gamma